MSDGSAPRSAGAGFVLGFVGGVVVAIVVYLVLRAAGVSSTIAVVLIPIVVGVLFSMGVGAVSSRRGGPR